MSVRVETFWGNEGDKRTPYMTRINTRPDDSGLRLNIFHRGDADLHEHDHIADFWTFPLVSYVESYTTDRGTDEEAMNWRVVRAFRLHFRRAEFAHRVLGAWGGRLHAEGRWAGYPDPGDVDVEKQIATLTWWGRRRRSWGFWVGAEWVPWRTYTGTPG